MLAIARKVFPGGGVGSRMDKQDSWKPIATAPFDCDLELAVIDYDGVQPLVFPCRRIVGGWVKAAKRERIDVRPTHWRQWKAG